MNLDLSPPEESTSPAEQRLAQITRIAVCVAVGIAAISICIAACQWRAVQEAQVRSTLIRDLTSRDLPVPEIVDLVNDPSVRRREEEDKANYCKEHYRSTEIALRRDLVAQKMSAEDIHLLLRAWSVAVSCSSRSTQEGAAGTAARQEADWILETLKHGRSAREIATILSTSPPRGGPASAPVGFKPKAE